MFTQLKVERSVYEVTDKSPLYRELRPHKTQRIVKSGHLSSLIESYKNNGSALKDVPILVDRYGKIRDGHHRYLAATALGIPYYIMEVSSKYNNMIAINTNQRNWNDGDFANYWDVMGRTPYKVYNKVKEEHPYISYGVLVSIFNKKSARLRSDSKEFKEGNLTLDHLDHVSRTVRQLSQLKSIGKNPPLAKSTHAKQQFQEAMLEALQNVSFDFKKFKKNLTTKKHRLNILAKRTDMLKEIYKVEGKEMSNNINTTILESLYQEALDKGIAQQFLKEAEKLGYPLKSKEATEYALKKMEEYLSKRMEVEE